MLTNTFEQQLKQGLNACIESFRLQSGFLGQPVLVERAAKEAERSFQGFAKATPNRDDAYAAARDFLHGKELDGWRRDLVASVLADSIPTAGNESVIGDKRLFKLLATYEDEANNGELWRLTWHGLLTSYFSFNPLGAESSAKEGWQALRGFLERTWPRIDSQSGSGLVPDWVEVLRKEKAVLTRSPVDRYSFEYLAAQTDSVNRLATNLGIPSSSWFWHQLVLGVVQCAAKLPDADFQRSTPRLIELIRSKPAFRDEAIEAILMRYYACLNTKCNDELRDFVVQNDIWRNPKLKPSGMAPSWNRVPNEVWRMVMTWVTERALRDFFDILSSRNSVNLGRLEFWSKYLEQITWTRLIFGSQTMALQHSNIAVKELIARERGDYAVFTVNRETDAFMMQIGNYVVIEFSVTSNAGYIYDTKTLPFDRNASHYKGGTTDLKRGFKTGQGERILHTPGWEDIAKAQLKELGIFPDMALNTVAKQKAITPPRLVQPLITSISETPPFSLPALRKLIWQFDGATYYFEGGKDGNHVWVQDRQQRKPLAIELTKFGFKWSEQKRAWYRAE